MESIAMELHLAQAMEIDAVCSEVSDKRRAHLVNSYQQRHRLIGRLASM
jgi:hypothetical protein